MNLHLALVERLIDIFPYNMYNWIFVFFYLQQKKTISNMTFLMYFSGHRRIDGDESFMDHVDIAL